MWNSQNSTWHSECSLWGCYHHDASWRVHAALCFSHPMSPCRWPLLLSPHVPTSLTWVKASSSCLSSPPPAHLLRCGKSERLNPGDRSLDFQTIPRALLSPSCHTHPPLVHTDPELCLWTVLLPSTLLGLAPLMSTLTFHCKKHRAFSA